MGKTENAHVVRKERKAALTNRRRSVSEEEGLKKRLKVEKGQCEYAGQKKKSEWERESCSRSTTGKLLR